MSRSIYPTAEQLVDGVIWPCKRVPRLKKAGLAAYELKMRFMEIQYVDLHPDYDDGEYEPDIDVYWRLIEVGPDWYGHIGAARAWQYMGSICDSLKFYGLPKGSSNALNRYLQDLEDKRMIEIGRIIE